VAATIAELRLSFVLNAATECSQCAPHRINNAVMLCPEDRRQRILASKRAWAERNREYVRKQNRENARKPENVAKRRQKYLETREALVALGYSPKRGRPRKYPDSLTRLACERELCRRRQEVYRSRMRAAAVEPAAQPMEPMEPIELQPRQREFADTWQDVEQRLWREGLN